MQITANGIALEFDAQGPEDGAPLILIRGLGSQMIHWSIALIEALADAVHRVIRFDNRDVGRSQRCPAPGVRATARDILAQAGEGMLPAPAYMLEDMARDVVGLMDALEIERAHVLGISMGGAIAQVLALEHGARLLSATIVMSACRPLAGAAAPDRLSALLARPMDEAAYVEAWVEEHRAHGSPGYPMPEAEIRAEARLAHARGYDAEGINRQLLAVAAAPGRCAGSRCPAW